MAIRTSTLILLSILVLAVILALSGIFKFRFQETYDKLSLPLHLCDTMYIRSATIITGDSSKTLTPKEYVQGAPLSQGMNYVTYQLDSGPELWVSTDGSGIRMEYNLKGEPIEIKTSDFAYIMPALRGDINSSDISLIVKGKEESPLYPKLWRGSRPDSWVPAFNFEAIFGKKEGIQEQYNEISTLSQLNLANKELSKNDLPGCVTFSKAVLPELGGQLRLEVILGLRLSETMQD